MKDQAKNLNRGFGFVEFKTKEVAQKAIDELNNSKWKGRTVTVNFSVPKLSYESKLDSLVEHTKMDRQTAAIPKVLREEKNIKKSEEEQKKKEKEEFEAKNATKLRK